MPIEKLNLHYSFTNPASIHDEEALTALELAGRQGAKINEVIHDQNALREQTETALDNQNELIDTRMDQQDANIKNVREVVVPQEVAAEVLKYITQGDFDRAINVYAGALESRLNEILGSVKGGSLSSADAELIDARIDHDGVNHATVGDSIRAISGEIAPLTYINETVTFEVGYLDSNNGAESNSDKYLRSTHTLPRNVYKVVVGDGYNIQVRIFQKTGAYVGCWTGNGATKDFAAFPALKGVNLETVRVMYPEHDFRVCVKRTDGATITAAEARNIMCYSFKIDDTLSLPMYMADAQAVNRELSLINYSVGGSVRKDALNKAWRIFTPPAEYTGTFFPVTLYTDGNVWKTDFRRERFMASNATPTTYYVSPDGDWTNSGLTRELPTGLYQAITRAAAGDTIIMMEGEYRRDNTQNSTIPTIDKDINIIGEGNVRIIVGQVASPVYDSVTGLYQLTESKVIRVFDPTFTTEYQRVSSPDLCQSTPNSYYVPDETCSYHNLPTASDLGVLVGINGFEIDPAQSDIRVYMENIQLIGGMVCLNVKAHAEHNAHVTLNRCKFADNVNGDAGNVRCFGGRILLHECESYGAWNDGISYASGSAANKTEFVEIGCKSHSNGGFYVNNKSDSSNGSTAHTGAKGIRVNGAYYNNKGGNVADVHEDTQTINCGCSAFESVATEKGYQEGFGAQQAGTKMWLFNCIAFGNFYDLYNVPNTAMYCNGCAAERHNFDTVYHGDYTLENPKELWYYQFIRTGGFMNQTGVE